MIAPIRQFVHLPVPAQPLSPQARRTRWGYLAIALLPITGSFALNWGWSLPHWGCPLLHWAGIPCPGWGLTRSFMAIARGEWQQAIAYHGFGLILFAAFVIASLHIGLELISGTRISTFYTSLVRSPKFQISAFLMLLGYHTIRLHDLAQSGLLIQSFVQSPLGQAFF